MKIQDIVFILFLLPVFYVQRPRLTVLLAVVCIGVSMPLFALKLSLFTAERLVLYAAGFFLVTIIFLIHRGNTGVMSGLSRKRA